MASDLLTKTVPSDNSNQASAFIQPVGFPPPYCFQYDYKERQHVLIDPPPPYESNDGNQTLPTTKQIPTAKVS